jgi:predicted CoA-binding protein
MNIEKFFASTAFAVIGASHDREKVGNKILRCYLDNNKTVYPIHPIEKQIENITCLKSIAQLPESVKSISIATPPILTVKIIPQAVIKGIKNIWMEPGSASKSAIDECIINNINVIADCSCIQEIGYQN